VKHDAGLEPIAKWVYRRKAEWSGKSENLFGDRHRQDLMINIVCSGVVHCDIWSYETDNGDVAAALVTFRHGNWRHYYTTHYDARWERLSPGQVLLFDVTRESLSEGLNVDFMTGEGIYKNRLATAMAPLYRVAATAAQVASWRNGAVGRIISAA